MTGAIEIQLNDPGMLAFKDKARCAVLVDGAEVGAMRIGETARFAVAGGEHELRVAMKVGLITRKTNRLRLTVAEGASAIVAGKYSRLWGKYSIAPSA
jgi:hypothetical protein